MQSIFQLVIEVIQNRSQKEKLFNLEKSSNSLRGILLNSFFIVNSLCVCVPPPKKNIEYSIPWIGNNRKNGSSISWNVYYNATNNCTNPPHMFFSYHKEKKKDPSPFVFGMKFCPRPPFELIDVFSGSVGTDGARTRSFRLDRAVL